jgi:KaiC/GvpD/RAD55 family RecA-like ATPase
MVLQSDSSAINITSELIAHERAKIGTSLADALLSQDDIRIEALLSKYSELMDASTIEDHVTEEYCGLTLHELEQKFETDGRWQLWPMRIGMMLKGGLRPGHSVVVAARPERGKTLFGITFTAGFLAQGAKVLYIGNEDPIPDLIMRLLSCITGYTDEQLLKHKDEAMRRAVEQGYNNCVFAGLSPGTLYEVEALVRRHEPDILVVDQMRNIAAKTENNTLRLEYVARELRNIARRQNCVVLAVTQVGDSGRDKLVLNDGDIDGSNTGIPGACDVILMVGSNDEYERMDLRMIKLAKNKLGGDHSELVVAVDRALSRVETHQ